MLIGKDISERLDIIPAKFRVIVTRRLKYAFKGWDGVIQARLRRPTSSKAACRPRCCWPRSQSPNMPTTCRCSCRRGFMPATGWRSTGGKWRSGWAGSASNWRSLPRM
uniref:IS66 family transposase zinc-finger binding domain-containing protein n=1 Tax=Paracoccus kondratievae TaxID=135740 RepID=UPI0022269C13|nr:IS66 family transposase zinc-finger binding domain-containing protein [Paracoccus kondratievae]